MKLGWTEQEQKLIDAATDRAHQHFLAGVAQLEVAVAKAPEYEPSWFADGRHRVAPTRAILQGILTHLRKNGEA